MFDLGGGVRFASSLTVADAWALDAEPDAVVRRLVAAVQAQLAAAPQHDVSFHLRPFRFVKGTLSIELQPPAQHATWRRPLGLELAVFAFTHDGQHWTMVLPVPGITLAGTGTEPPFDELRRAIVAWWRRQRAQDPVRVLATLAAAAPAELAEFALPVPVFEPRLAADRELAGKRRQPLVELLLRPASRDAHRTGTGLDEALRRAADALARGRSVLFLGPPGVGKSLATQLLARRAAALGLDDRRFWSGSGTMILTRGSSAQLDFRAATIGLCEELRERQSRMHDVVGLGNLTELLAIGPSSGTRQSIASLLAPYCASGHVVTVVEESTERWDAIERDHPGVVQAFECVELRPPDATRLVDVLASIAPAGCPRAPLQRLVGLFDRFAPYAGQPGAAIRMLERIVETEAAVGGDAEVTEAQLLGAFSRETGIPLLLLDSAQPLIGSEVHDWFARRVRHQEPAVQAVTTRILQWKAELSRRDRPLASMLFLGPTGVGKTELCKALAEFLFGTADRLVRFDMSEYADPVQLLRLVGGPQGEGLLTARIREQPFSVVLFDEFEKADPTFGDLLLQVLGSGRLTDSAGRIGWFHSAVVILTSNLGAETFAPDGLAFGRRDVQQAARQHYEQALRQHLRPELYNRLDAWVPFAPLGEAAALELVQMQMDRLQRRPWFRERNTEVVVEDAALRAVATDGVDDRYGARPLLRAVDRHVVAAIGELLAGASNRQPPAEPAVLRVSATAAGVEVSADWRERVDAERDPGDMAALRRAAHEVEDSALVRELRTAGQRLRAQLGRSIDAKKPAAKALVEAELLRIEQLVQRVTAVVHRAEDAEDRAFVAMMQDPGAVTAVDPVAASERDSIDAELLGVVCALADYDEPSAAEAVLWIACNDREVLQRFVAAYADVFRDLGHRTAITAVVLVKAKGNDEPVVASWSLESSSLAEVPSTLRPDQRIADAPEKLTEEQLAWAQQHGPAAACLHVRGPHVKLLLQREVGAHLWRATGRPAGDVALQLRVAADPQQLVPEPSWFVNGRPPRPNHCQRVYVKESRGDGVSLESIPAWIGLRSWRRPARLRSLLRHVLEQALRTEAYARLGS